MRVRVPANIDMADRIFAGLTLRQLAILSADALLLWLLFFAVGEHLPPVAFGVVAAPVAAAGILTATARPEGMTVERLFVAAARYLTSPRKRVLAPDGIPDAPAWAPDIESVASLDLPLTPADRHGVVNLRGPGTALLARATSVNLGLLSEREQELLIGGFGQLLNALDGPMQFVVRSEAADARTLIGDLERMAAKLAHPALEEPAREHLAFLRSLAERRDVLRRNVIVCFRDAGADEGARARLTRRLDEAASLLRGVGVKLTPLAQHECNATLARACDETTLDSEAMRLPQEVAR